MTKTEPTSERGKQPRKTDLKEARPLLQAIFLGLVLASGLMAAAAMANPDQRKAHATTSPAAVDVSPATQAPPPASGARRF